MADIVISDIIQSGADTVKVYKKVVSADPVATTVTFAATDLIGYLQSIDGMGASKEVSEFNLYHKKDAIKQTKSSTLNDINFTEALTSTQLTAIRGAYNENDLVVVGMFSEDGDLVYGGLGSISEWGLTLPENDVAQVTYTMAMSRDDVTCAEPA